MKKAVLKAQKEEIIGENRVDNYKSTEKNYIYLFLKINNNLYYPTKSGVLSEC